MKDHTKLSFGQASHLDFRDLAFDGAYPDKGFEKLKGITIKRIRGQILQWGTRRRGIIPTGDNRTNTYEQLGNRPCFIKIGEPTADGLRQVLTRFRSANAAITTPVEVVFMGDSITELWERQPEQFFPGKPYVNRGIGGQTTPQMRTVPYFVPNHLEILTLRFANN